MLARVISPAFTQVPRISAIRYGQGGNTPATLLTGRWCQLDANGNAAVVGTSRDLADCQGLYWIIEGTHNHIGTTAEFDGTSKMSTNMVELPSVKAQGAVALVFGVFRGEVGPEGVDNSDHANYDAGDKLTIDQYGRLIVANGTTDLNVAVAETVTEDANGVTSLVFRTLGN